MNRKQRRAQQSASSASSSIQNADQIPMRMPDRERKLDGTSKSKTKTLYEIAAEKQAELLPQAERMNAATGTKATRMPSKPDASNLVTVKVGPDGMIVHDDNTNRPFRVEDLNKNNNSSTTTTATDADTGTESEQLPPVIDTLMLAISLGAVHFTLEFLTAHQYAEEVDFSTITRHTCLTAIPTLFFLVHLFHGHLFAVPFLSSATKYVLLQVGFVAVANAAGCYLIHLTNESGYYAVMKNAPSIGTVWVWSIIELGLVGALAGVVGPGLYAWWYGYGIY